MILTLFFGFFVTMSSAFAQIDNRPPTVDDFDEEKILLKTIANALVENEEQKLQSGILISSSTIFAFLSFGSLLTIRFDGGSRRKFATLVKLLMICLFIIAATQIYTIISIATGYFDTLIYVGTLIVVITFFGLILLFSYQIIAERSREPEVKNKFANATNFFQNMLTKN